MAARCEICGREIDPRDMAYCRYCKTPYHIGCIKSRLYHDKSCLYCGRSTSLAHYRRGMPDTVERGGAQSRAPAATAPDRRAESRPSRSRGGGKVLFIINIMIIAILLASIHYTYSYRVEYGPYLLADENSKTTLPGQTVDYTVTLQNTGNIFSRYDIFVDDDSVAFPAGWQITLLDESAAYEDLSIEVSLKPEEKYRFTVRISTTSGSEANAQGTFKIIARTKDGKFASSQVFVVYTDTIYDFELDGDDTEGYVAVGGEVQFSAQIENTGSGADTYDITLEDLTSGWSARLLEQQVTIEADSIGSVILIMTAPSNAQGNDVGEVVLKVSSQSNPEDVKTVTFSATVNPSYSFDVTSTEMSREVLPGTTTNFTFKLMNMGNLSDTYDLSATSSLPSGWTYKLSKESVTLEEDGQITIGVSIVVPEDAPGSIEGTVNLEIMSRGNRDTEAMNFNVSTVEEQNKFVLLEVFTYIGCPYCPYAEKAAEDLLINYPGRIVVLEYHGMGDSFETAFSSERGSKYAVGGYPSAMIDGNRKVKGGNSNTYNEYVSFVEPLLDDEPLVRIQATVSDSTLSPGEKDINVIIKPQGLDSYTSVNVIFVTFRNGLSLPNHASNVYNYVVVDGFESRISLLNKTEDVTITMDIPEDGGVVIIVQDADTKKVYQSIVV